MDKPAWIAMASALSLGACAMMDDGLSGSDGGTGREDVPCPVLDSRDWTAFVNGMPGPNAQPKLIVTGTIDLPTAGWRVGIRAGIADRSATPTQQVELILTKPGGMVAQVVTPTEVRYEGQALSQTYKAVVVKCEDRTLATISPIEVAQ